jgi:spore coat-associated protein N
MKKILFSLSVIAAAAAVITGGTLAYFSDTETSTGNTFTAGTLNLKVGASDPMTEVISETNKKPGDFGSYDWLLKNDGSLGGFLEVVFSNLVDEENLVNEPEDADPDENGTVASPGTDGELAEVLALKIYIDENNNNTYDTDPADKLIYNGFASGIIGERLDDYAMAANYGSGGDKAVRIEWSVDSGVGNKIQSDRAGFDIAFSLEQVAD